MHTFKINSNFILLFFKLKLNLFPYIKLNIYLYKYLITIVGKHIIKN